MSGWRSIPTGPASAIPVPGECDEVGDECVVCADDNDCGFCYKCNTGSGLCEPQTASEDTKGECPADPCMTGFCDGGGACGFSPAATACDDGLYCNGTEECDGAGSCGPASTSGIEYGVSNNAGDQWWRTV